MLATLTITSFKTFEESTLDKFVLGRKSVSVINESKTKVPAPIFQITPQSVTIPSCTSQPITFQCVVTNGVPVNCRYFWTIGPGWTLPSGECPTLANSITLTPLTSTAVTSSVSVRILDFQGGSEYYGGLATLSRQAYSSDVVVNGSDSTACLGGTNIFNLTGLKSGENLVWS